MKYDQIDIPAVGVLNQSKELKAATWKRVKSIRQKIKDAPLWAGNLRLDLLKAECAHREALQMERDAIATIERRAAELGVSL